MRHRKRTLKLGRTTDHREAMLANMTCSLINHNRIKTTLAKAKALRPYAEKMVTLGKKGSLHNRRIAIARLDGKVDEVQKLFSEIAPRYKDREGGYTRILKIGPRQSDASNMAYIEWVEATTVAPAAEEEKAKPAAKKKAATAKKAAPEKEDTKVEEKSE